MSGSPSPRRRHPCPPRLVWTAWGWGHLIGGLDAHVHLSPTEGPLRASGPAQSFRGGLGSFFRQPVPAQPGNHKVRGWPPIMSDRPHPVC